MVMCLFLVLECIEPKSTVDRLEFMVEDAYSRRVVIRCARYGQSPNSTKNRKEQGSKKSDQSIGGENSRKRDVSFLEDGDLDTGKELPTNALQLTKQNSLG